MRLKVTLDKTSQPSCIPINCSYHLASAIYRAIERADPNLSLELHKPNTPKFFTFSKLMVPNRKFRIEKDKMFLEDDKIHFFFSTMKSELAEKLVEGLFMDPEIKIADSNFVVSEVEILREKEIGNKAEFVTLSPIHVSKFKDGKTIDLYPTEKEFYDVLVSNLIEKYILFYKRTPESTEVNIEVTKFKPKRIMIKNTWHRCVEMVFKAEGDPELLEIGYKAGFGAKNSMGFGMVKVV